MKPVSFELGGSLLVLLRSSVIFDHLTFFNIGVSNLLSACAAYTPDYQLIW